VLGKSYLLLLTNFVKLLYSLMQIFDRNWHKLSMSFLANEIILYLDCQQITIAELGENTRSAIDINGNIFLAKNEDDRATQVSRVSRGQQGSAVTEFSLHLILLHILTSHSVTVSQCHSVTVSH